MKKVTGCPGCSECAVRLGFGFCQADTLICTKCGDEVSAEDGCTLGAPGEPTQAVEACEVGVEGRVGYGYEVLA